MKRMKELEDENRRLKKMYAEEKLKAEIAREVIKKVVKPSRRKEMAHAFVWSARSFPSVRLAIIMKHNYRMKMLRLPIGSYA